MTMPSSVVLDICAVRVGYRSVHCRPTCRHVTGVDAAEGASSAGWRRPSVLLGRADAAASYVNERITGITEDLAAIKPGGRRSSLGSELLAVLTKLERLGLRGCLLLPDGHDVGPPVLRPDSVALARDHALGVFAQFTSVFGSPPISHRPDLNFLRVKVPSVTLQDPKGFYRGGSIAGMVEARRQIHAGC